MSDTAAYPISQEVSTRDCLRAELRHLLAQFPLVSPAMIEAGSRALAETLLTRDGRGRLVFRPGGDEEDNLTVIWQAMLAAKLAEVE